MARKKARRNPSLERARRQARAFHGTDDGTVVELGPQERRGGSRYRVLLGALDGLRYIPPAHSERGGVVWEHDAGDRGPTQPRARRRPLLVADPATGEIQIVKHRSPMRFSPRRGIVG